MSLRRLTIAILSLCLAVPVFAWEDEKTDDQLVAELTKILTAEGPQAESAATMLAELGEKAKSSVPTLIQSLESKNHRLRLASAIALFDIDSANPETIKKVVATIVRCLSDEDNDVQREAIKVLSRDRKATPDQVKAIAKALVDNDDFVSAHAAEALSKMGARAVPVLMEAAKDPKSVIWAVLALGDIGPDAKPAQKVLVETANDADPLIRQESALALGKIKADPEVALPVLKKLLVDERTMVKAAAAFSLVSYGEAAKDALPLLRSLTESKDPLTNVIAALAWIEIDAPSGDDASKLAKLIAVGLQHPNPVARRECAKGLGKLGKASLFATEKLTELADKDPIDGVKLAAKTALEQIKN